MELLGSFAGAAFAFGFFLFGQTLQRAYERRLLHYNSLVRLERMLNLQLDQAHRIPVQVGDMHEPVARGQILVAVPRPILELDDLFLELLDLELTNALMDHRVSVERVNSDIRDMSEAYAALKVRYLDGGIDRDTYCASGDFLVSKYGQLADAVSVMQSEVLDLLSLIRLRLAEPRPVSFRVAGRLSRLKLRDISATNMAKERAKLEKECAASRNPYLARGVPNNGIDTDKPRHEVV